MLTVYLSIDMDGALKALDDKRQELLFKLYDEKQHSIAEICELVGVSKTTLYDYLRRRDEAGSRD